MPISIKRTNDIHWQSTEYFSVEKSVRRKKKYIDKGNKRVSNEHIIR